MTKNGEVVIIRPKFLDMPEKKPKMSETEIRQYVEKRANDKGKNVALFFDAVYNNLRVSPDWRGNESTNIDSVEYGISEGWYRFSPDSLKVYESGPVYGEVKVSAFRNAKFWCSPKQFVRYFLLLEDMLELGHEIPQVDYGLFKYGTRDDYQLHNCPLSGRVTKKEKHLCDDRCLTGNLTKKIHDLTIIPFNLLLAIFMSNKYSKIGSMDHSTSKISTNDQGYFWLKGKLCSRLHGDRIKPVENIEQLLGDSISTATYELLGLDNLNIERYDSPDNLYCLPTSLRGFPYKINQFPIVRLEMRKDTEKEWINNFRNYGRELLKYCLEIDDPEKFIEEPYSDFFIVETKDDEVPF